MATSELHSSFFQKFKFKFKFKKKYKLGDVFFPYRFL